VIKKRFIAYFPDYPDGMILEHHYSIAYIGLKVFLFSRWLVN